MVPVHADYKSDKISPNKLDATITSNHSGISDEPSTQYINMKLISFDLNNLP